MRQVNQTNFIIVLCPQTGARALEIKTNFFKSIANQQK